MYVELGNSSITFLWQMTTTITKVNYKKYLVDDIEEYLKAKKIDEGNIL